MYTLHEFTCNLSAKRHRMHNDDDDSVSYIVGSRKQGDKKCVPPPTSINPILYATLGMPPAHRRDSIVRMNRPAGRLLHHHGIWYSVPQLGTLVVVWMRVGRNRRRGHRGARRGTVGRRIRPRWWLLHVCLRGRHLPHTRGRIHSIWRRHPWRVRHGLHIGHVCTRRPGWGHSGRHHLGGINIRRVCIHVSTRGSGSRLLFIGWRRHGHRSRRLHVR